MRIPLLLALGMAVFAIPATAEERCRQALALGLDVSGSVDSREYRMQLDGLAAALSNSEVTSALLAMPGTAVRIMVYEWSGPKDQTILLPWTTISDQRTVERVAAQLALTTRTPSEQSTGLGAAMLFGANQLAQQVECWPHTLDISGDGKSNTGPHPKDLNDSTFRDITINALVIGADPLDHGDNRQAEIGELSSYFNAYVLRGLGSFAEVALGFEDYERAMIRKLKRELEGMALSQNNLSDQ